MVIEVFEIMGGTEMVNREKKNFFNLKTKRH